MSAINKGDLVYISKPCCGSVAHAIFEVGHLQFIMRPVFVHCNHCGYDDSFVTVASAPDFRWNVPTHWLKRIEPPAHTEDLPMREELTA